MYIRIKTWAMHFKFYAMLKYAILSELMRWTYFVIHSCQTNLSKTSVFHILTPTSNRYVFDELMCTLRSISIIYISLCCGCEIWKFHLLTVTFDFVQKKIPMRSWLTSQILLGIARVDLVFFERGGKCDRLMTFFSEWNQILCKSDKYWEKDWQSMVEHKLSNW